jgi:hypothetical protein
MGETTEPLGCQDCPWTGAQKEYALLDQGKVNSTAVCPVCGGRLRLTFD